MKQETKAFDTLYAMLNKEQRAAVDTIDGPVMVIAGPGTGKTQILTLRIANILRQSDIPADAILALTFTNAAAANMRKRLVSIIGSDGYRVSIYTFHSFADHLIERYPEWFPRIAGYSNCSDVERIDILRQLMDQAGTTGQYEILRPIADPYRNIPDILSGISHLKREGMTPETFAAWIKSEQETIEASDDLYHTKGAHAGKMKGVYQKELRMLDKLEELRILYVRYREELARRKRYDFDDALLTLIEAFTEHENFLREIQEEYQYFLVDEHQDTNGAQNKILELLVTYFDQPNLFVVGDEKQAVFRFQGASLDNFLYFEKKFRGVDRITLATNYRSHQGILDAAHTLIGHNAGGIEAPLTAHDSFNAGTDPNVKVYEFSADDEELLFLAESVQGLLGDGVPPHEIAVLYRTNGDVEEIADYFERLGIPFIIESGHGVLDDADVRKLNQILRVLAEPDNDDELARVLFLRFFDIPIQDVYALIREARHEKRTLFETIASPRSDLARPLATQELYEKLSSWKSAAENEAFLNVFERVVRESGLLTHIQDSSFHTEKFDKLVRLFDEIKAHVRRHPFFSIGDYVTFLRILEEHNLTLEAPSRQVPNAVRLMTAHKAKGLEFDHVFIVHAYDGHWGGRRNRTFFRLPYRAGDGAIAGNDTEDERRLFYVALTRARKEVYVSYASRAPDGRERVPTQFLEEMRDDLKTFVHGDSLGYALKRPPLFVERKGRHGALKYRDFVREAFAQRGLSATALNNYLTCPWKWFYESFFHTRFVPTVHQIKGTATHKALEEFFEKRNKKPNTGYEYLAERFSLQMEDTDLDPAVQARVLNDTLDALKGWHDTHAPTWAQKTVNELLISGVLLGEDIRLTGKLDKLECLDDRCREVRVVDYKTGKPKSRNDIEGLTKTAQRSGGGGGYKRQLVFYKLLLDRYADGMYSMQEGVLDFIQPTESGKYKKEAFVIGPEQTTELEETIRRVASEIRELSFWDTRCDDQDCSECALRELME
jgi:DNA helicase II / ATP-dependent DNA helicase PcrA